MTIFDYIAFGVVGFSLLMGLWRGVVGELIALAAWALAILAAVRFGTWAGQALFASIGDPVLRLLAGWIAVFVGVLVIMAVVRMIFSRMVKALGLSVSDRLLGMVFGVVRGVLVCMVMVGLGGMTSAPRQDWWQDARFSAPFETIVMVAKPWLPDDLAKRIRFS